MTRVKGRFSCSVSQFSGNKLLWMKWLELCFCFGPLSHPIPTKFIPMQHYHGIEASWWQRGGLSYKMISHKTKKFKYILIALWVSRKYFSFFSKKTCCGYSLEAHWRGFSNEYHKTCLHGEIRKISTISIWKSSFLELCILPDLLFLSIWNKIILKFSLIFYSFLGILWCFSPCMNSNYGTSLCDGYLEFMDW